MTNRVLIAMGPRLDFGHKVSFWRDGSGGGARSALDGGEAAPRSEARAAKGRLLRCYGVTLLWAESRGFDRLASSVTCRTKETGKLLFVTVYVLE